MASLATRVVMQVGTGKVLVRLLIAVGRLGVGVMDFPSDSRTGRSLLTIAVSAPTFRLGNS